ncbi:H(+)/Cl(-) exchange transporter 6 isoform X2 [Nematostella vectensis]|uniref:H(+)/Cl(-) exchange transporter 6 isoform X2 n=1 Tax=Nematostella vectensis TaxID=45351 RepID=UPI001390254F|nr:H(+)/Cl(-) exchange transporter 6 isoform X2 [Nematostella vectensis]
MDYQELELEDTSSDVFHKRKELPRKDYESLDYDVCYNKPFSAMLQSKENMSLKKQNLIRWVVTFVIGVLTGLVAVFIDYFIKMLTDLKFQVVEKSLNLCTPEGCLVITLVIMMLFNGGFTLIAGCLTAMEPVAAGSGIPEIKCYLNGIKVPHVVRLKTLVSKAVGVLFSVAGGLFVGKEGPMIHSGAIIGAGVPQFQSLAFSKINFNFPYFRTDRDKRDFVSGGAAAGVAAAFGAPIGGVLFSLEEGSSFWNQDLTWRTFFCSMSASFTLNMFLSGINNFGWGSFYQPGLINFGVFQCNKAPGKKCDLWNIQDLLIFIIMGFVGGLLGAWFNSLNRNLTIHRILYVNSRRKFVKILEAILVALVTTSIAFFCPVYLGSCLSRDLPSQNINLTTKEVKSYFCSKGEYNDMATLFFNSQEGAIKQLFHLDGAFSLPSLAIFFICFYFLACWTYGASVPSGLFVPCLLCGAAYGRFIGELLRRFVGYDHTYHGTFALIGAASFLGGVVRMTISLTVILIESTNEISYGLPIMITLMVAKWSGDLFNEGLYDIHIKLKSIPLLEWSAPSEMYRLKAWNIMESCLSYIYPHTRLHSIIGILKTTAHNAFPVVTVDKASAIPGDVSDYPDNPLTSNEQYAKSTTRSFVVSEQQLRRATSEDSLGATVRSRGRSLSGQGIPDGSGMLGASAAILSTSAPPQSYIGNAADNDLVVESHGLEEEIQFSDSQELQPSQVDGPSNIIGEMQAWLNSGQMLTLHGFILRSQLVTLIKKGVYYDEKNGKETQQVVDFSGMTEEYPRFPDIHSIHIEEDQQEMIMDVTPYMNPCPYVVFPWTPVPLVFNLFRTMGLRHLGVTNSKGQLVGIITRANLTHEHMEHCLHHLSSL